MNNKNLIQKVSNQIMTWSNNTLFSEEHSVASKVAKEEKKYDHILFIPKKKETGIPITSSAEGVQRLDWYSNQLSDHWLIYTELNIGGEKLTVGSFNIQNLLGLDKSLYTLQDLVDYFRIPADLRNINYEQTAANTRDKYKDSEGVNERNSINQNL